MLSALSVSSCLFVNIKPPPVSGFTRFQFTITGTDFTGGPANNYPITFNSSATASSTWGDISNFTKTNAQNNNITLYFKGKWLPTDGSILNNPRIFAFTSNTIGDLNNFINVTNADNIGKSINYALASPGAFVDGVTGQVLTNATDYFHTFLRFNSSTAKFSYYFYKNDSAATPLFNTGEITYVPATIMTNFTKYRLAYELFGNKGSWVTIGEAGWYNSVLTTENMQAVVKQNPN
jgi:hypothetical protein